MNYSLFKKTGKCQNCGEKDQELEEVEFKDKKKLWCECCVEGLEIEKELKV